MIEIPSNLIWIIGLVLLVVALAFLWNLKLSTHAAQSLSLEKEPETAVPESDVEMPRYKGMPVLAPAPPPVVIVVEETEPEMEKVEEARVEVKASVNEAIVDCDDAERMLSLAWKLEVHGDFEGRDEFAKIVLEKPEASPRQRDRAQAMLRNESIS
ncbi:hypothetical protein H8F21_15260 [Pseudomonas sp. P66]|uniref:Uncharacterized protein n=1 Tax=Pseudomonas arcuscaelestis TaxID=2710591 RepID=A0ABS2BZ79_9PSED|nr:hypothetical protein [Pseudomonas arcuscaelestis]MBM5458924.1 hypothetical protein [Pseudomonas arcuscaelestis]